MTAARTRWWGLIFISLAVALIIVDSTIISVSIPSIIEDLGITSTQVQWVQESYTIVFAALILVYGTLADKYGRRRLLVIGTVIFTLASIIAGLSQTGDLLIAARVLQGIGGAMLLPTSLSLINATFQGKERGIAFAVWGSTIGGMVAVGPLLGGWLTTDFSWRWAFGINVPLGIIIVIGVMLTVIESKDGLSTRAIDWVGALWSIVAMSALVFALIEGRTYGWWLTNKPFTIGGFTWPEGGISVIPVIFALAAAAIVMFITHGLRRIKKGKSALIAFHLFSIPSFRNGNIAALIISLGEFGIVLSIPLYLQFVIGYDALQTGWVLIALALGSFVASGLAGGLGSKVSPVTMVRTGIVLEAVGVAGLGVAISTTSTWLNIVPFLFVYGIGVGLATAQLSNVILKDVPVIEGGQASGTQSTSRQLGSALGIAILGTILFTSTQVILTNDLTDEKLPAAQVTQVVNAVVDSAGGAIVGLEANPTTRPIADHAKAAITDGTKYAAYAASGFLLLGFLSTLSLGAARKNEESEMNARGDKPVA